MSALEPGRGASALLGVGGDLPRDPRTESRVPYFYNRICYSCGGTGHLAASCPSWSGRCFRCGAADHKSWQCARSDTRSPTQRNNVLLKLYAEVKALRKELHAERWAWRSLRQRMQPPERRHEIATNPIRTEEETDRLDDETKEDDLQALHYPVETLGEEARCATPPGLYFDPVEEKHLPFPDGVSSQGTPAVGVVEQVEADSIPVAIRTFDLEKTSKLDPQAIPWTPVMRKPTAQERYLAAKKEVEEILARRGVRGPSPEPQDDHLDTDWDDYWDDDDDAGYEEDFEQK